MTSIATFSRRRENARHPNGPQPVEGIDLDELRAIFLRTPHFGRLLIRHLEGGYRITVRAGRLLLERRAI